MIRVFIFLFFLKVDFIIGQTNLVPNGSFEEYTICPNNAGQLYYAVPWFQPNNFFGNTTNSCSSDLFNFCTSFNMISVPSNGAGYQLAKSGFSYSGINLYSYVFSDSVTYSREYIEVQLISPLIDNNSYCISFYISLADTSDYAVSNIGVYFSKDSLLYSSGAFENINVIPQIRNPETNIIEDKKNWILVSGEYTASGGEQFITIGNFDSNINTSRKKVGGALNIAYYYIDDVSVVLCEDTLNPTDTFYLHIPNIFTPNADGQNDVWQVRATGVQQLSAAVYNRWGALLWQQSVEDTTAQTEIKTAWSGYTSTGIPVSAGTYYYLVSYTTKEGETKKEKGFLTLVR